MEANELRIGNLIYWDIPEKLNKPHEVIGIRNNITQTIPISLGNSIYDYKPIPLTEEILLKIGFKESLVGYEIDTSGTGFKKPCLNGWWVTKRFLGDKIDTPFLRFHSITDVYYVHQLQNLYFALTGEELNVTNLLP